MEKRTKIVIVIIIAACIVINIFNDYTKYKNKGAASGRRSPLLGEDMGKLWGGPPVKKCGAVTGPEA